LETAGKSRLCGHGTTPANTESIMQKTAWCGGWPVAGSQEKKTRSSFCGRQARFMGSDPEVLCRSCPDGELRLQESGRCALYRIAVQLTR
jgi:hypothetical protein